MTYGEFATEHVTDVKTREAITKNPIADTEFNVTLVADIRDIIGVAFENGGSANGIAQLISAIGITRGMVALRDLGPKPGFLVRVANALEHLN